MKFTTQLLICTHLLAFQCLLNAQVIVEHGSSEQFHAGSSGKLEYTSDAMGNCLPDFSYVGYHSGERPIPEVPVRITLEPGTGDDTERIQDALDQLGTYPQDPSGHRGALLLKKGFYQVAGTISISQSGIVLLGEGDGPGGTVIIATGYDDLKYKRTLITVGPGEDTLEAHTSHRYATASGQLLLEVDSRREIIDDYVPVGSSSFSVSSTAGYKTGDKILVYRPSTADWISSIGCDQLEARWAGIRDTRWVKEGDFPGFYYQRLGYDSQYFLLRREGESWEDFVMRVPLSEDGKKFDFTRQWQAGEYDFYFERSITGIEGNRISIDIPLVHSMDVTFGGGAVYQYQAPGRITEVGIENLRLVSEFAEPVEGHPYGDPEKMKEAETHAWNGIQLKSNTENTWVRNVTGNYFGWSLVSASGKRATVQDCVNLGHASIISGGRRYPFMIDGQLNLVQRCLTYEGRHEFVTQAKTAGPNVFVDCIGINSKSNAGPHHRYSVGTLFDNVKSEKPMESRFRGNSGTGHGWAGTQTCFYNCIAPAFLVEVPPGGVSWVIGSGTEQHMERQVTPASLYYQQVLDRLGKSALDHLVTEEQRNNLGKFHWVKERIRKETIHVWDTHELTFKAENPYVNPYMDVEMWVLLTGPEGSGFENTKVWGFWDGDNVFRARVTATLPGVWKWESGSNQNDGGLNGKRGSYTARDWTEAEKRQNPNRRGTVRPTPNNRAFMYADGTPFFLLSDTHWGSSSWRLPFTGKEPPADFIIDKDNYSFEGSIQWLKNTGFNSITTIFSHPGWNVSDGRTPKVTDCRGYIIRQAKEKTGFDKVRGMHDEEGNMPFFFTVKSGCPEDIMPDYDSINPEYWKNLDKKFRYMQDIGFVWYAEGARRDHGQTWKEYFSWPESYARYLNYLQARYGTYNMIFSLMHGDTPASSISFDEWNEAFDYWYEYYGDLPFGQVQTLMGKSTLRDFGHVTEHPWMQAHTVGNGPKHHGMEENLIKIWNKEPHIPGFCNEPYYVNFNKPWNAVGGEIPAPNSSRDNYLARAHAYGHVLSGGLPGQIIGTGSRWDNSKEEPDDPDYPGGWETLHYPIMKQASYMKEWILSAGIAYRDLDLAGDDLSSPKAPGSILESLEGWSHMMCTPDKKLAFLYFENGAVSMQTISGLQANQKYRAQWYDPRTGKWIDMVPRGMLKTSRSGSLTLPDFPVVVSQHNDWAARLMVKD